MICMLAGTITRIHIRTRIHTGMLICIRIRCTLVRTRFRVELF